MTDTFTAPQSDAEVDKLLVDAVFAVMMLRAALVKPKSFPKVIDDPIDIFPNWKAKACHGTYAELAEALRDRKLRPESLPWAKHLTRWEQAVYSVLHLLQVAHIPIGQVPASAAQPYTVGPVTAASARLCAYKLARYVVGSLMAARKGDKQILLVFYNLPSEDGSEEPLDELPETLIVAEAELPALASAMLELPCWTTGEYKKLHYQLLSAGVAETPRTPLRLLKDRGLAVNGPVPIEDDGPVESRTFRWRGELYGGCNPTAWRLIKFLWTNRGRKVGYVELGHPVWEQHKTPLATKVGSARREANRFFREKRIPLRVKTGGGFAELLDAQTSEPSD